MYFHSYTVYCVVFVLYFLPFLLFVCHAEAPKKEPTNARINGRREVKDDFDPLDTFSPIDFNSIRLNLPSTSFTEPAILFSIGDSLEQLASASEDDKSDQLKEQVKDQPQQPQSDTDNNIILSVPELGLGMNKGNGTMPMSMSTSTSTSPSGLRTNDPEFTKMVSIIAFFAILFIGIFAWLFSKHCCFRPKSLTSGDPNCPRTRASLPLSPQFNFMGVQVIRRFNNSNSQMPTPEKSDDPPPKYEDLFPDEYLPNPQTSTTISEPSPAYTTRQTNPDNNISTIASTSNSSSNNSNSNSKNDETEQS